MRTEVGVGVTPELVIRGGETLVGDRLLRVDVGVRDGRICAIGDGLAGGTLLDATGALVLPGGLDMHVHLTVPGGAADHFVDDFASGSRAAAAGGITTVGNMCPPLPAELPSSTVSRFAAAAREHSLVDFVLHPIVSDPSGAVVGDLESLANAGRVSVKVFMSYGDFDHRVPEYLQLIAEAGRRGLITMIHCEDQGIIDHCTQRLGVPVSSAAALGLSRPPAAELAAVSRAVAFCDVTRSPIYVVHVSTSAAVTAIADARGRGLPIFAEVRPIYLFFSCSSLREPDAALYASHPPLRGDAEVAALWEHLLAGEIDTYCSDHAPWMRRQKHVVEHGADVIRPGVAELDTMLPALFSAGVATGRLSVRRFAELTSTNAARIFGLYPRKGRVAIGSDADLVVWDARLSRSATAARGFSRSDYSLYEGREIRGWPRYTVRRGELIYAEGAIEDRAGPGEELRRGVGPEADR